MDWRKDLPKACRGGALAIGNFDGAHRGHAELIRQLVQEARRVGGPAVAMTFHPHPRALLRPDVPVALLTTNEDREAQLRLLGADHVLTLQVTPDLLGLRAREFFDRIIRERLDAKVMIEGTNFCFGYQREGDISLLSQFCEEAGISLRVVPPVVWDGFEVSSSLIRQALESGDVSHAASLLGRPYLVRGLVEQGQHRGRTIGYPTANIGRIETVVPAEGVYGVRVVLTSGASYAGAVNVGPNPTFGEQANKVETHIIGFEGDLYGKELRLEFLARLRDTQRFASVRELTEQLKRDTAKASEIAMT